jgi:hypothetical protein
MLPGVLGRVTNDARVYTALLLGGDSITCNTLGLCHSVRSASEGAGGVAGG